MIDEIILSPYIEKNSRIELSQMINEKYGIKVSPSKIILNL